MSRTRGVASSSSSMWVKNSERVRDRVGSRWRVELFYLKRAQPVSLHAHSCWSFYTNVQHSTQDKHKQNDNKYSKNKTQTDPAQPRRTPCRLYDLYVCQFASLLFLFLSHVWSNPCHDLCPVLFCLALVLLDRWLKLFYPCLRSFLLFSPQSPLRFCQSLTCLSLHHPFTTPITQQHQGG